MEECLDGIIESGIPKLRDPFVLVENGVYYMYGTGWVCYKNVSGRLDGYWDGPYDVVKMSDDNGNDGDHWAPEVHKYNGLYYMITTYHSARTGHRGCTVLRADDPMGSFEEISDGQITPHDWDCIDGTLYIDKASKPWLVFVHEWTSTDDGIGRFAYAQLSEDITHIISEPVEMFRADDSFWSDCNVTDGCWMYTTNSGSLLMLWSNFDKQGYCVGIARSDNKALDGKWLHKDNVLFSKALSRCYDGGHGMIFVALDGNMYMSIHSPNTPVGSREEMPVFVPIAEENDTLVWKR